MRATTSAMVATAAALAIGGAAIGAIAFTPKKHALLGGGKVGAERTRNHLDVHFTTIRISQDGKSLHFYGDWTAPCAGGQIVTANISRVTPLRSDGSFSAAGTLKSSLAEGAFRFDGKLSRLVRGGQTVEAAAGTGRSSLTFHPKPGRSYRCRTPLVGWQVRSNPRVRGAPSPKPGGVYYGSNSQTEPVVLRVSRDGRRIVQAGTEFALRCKRKGVVFDGDVVPTTPIKASGLFSSAATYRSHRGDLRWGAGNVAYYVATFRGRFGAFGVGGALRVDAKVVGASGKVVDTCSSFTTFAASL